MGSGVSSLARLRKAVLIRAYNLRASDQTLIDQFMPFTYQKDGKGLYISIHQIKKCLKMESSDYKWVEEVLQAVFTVPTTPPVQKSHLLKPSELYFYDFIQFLETGKAPNTFSEDPNKPPDGRKKSFNNSNSTSPKNQTINSSTDKGKDSPNRPKRFPPIPPSQLDPGNNSREDKEGDEDDSKRGEEVMEINLSRVDAATLPDSLKLHDSEKKVKIETKPPEETLEVIVRPGGGRLPLGMKTNGKALWRKREVMKQERSVHYTTIDDDGGLQELVEKETTQTEVLHMECRETGEFAHRELTEFEQLETFNDELVNAVRGNEEYVHLKSLEDEFHYMESNMPPKEDKETGLDDKEEQQRVESPQKPFEGKEDEADYMAAAKDLDREGEYGQYTQTNEQDDDNDPLPVPEVKTPPSSYQVPEGGYSPMSHLYERAAENFQAPDDHRNEQEEENQNHYNDRMSRQESEDDEILLQEPGSVKGEDSLNNTARLGSTRSSYQSLHEID